MVKSPAFARADYMNRVFQYIGYESMAAAIEHTKSIDYDFGPRTLYQLSMVLFMNKVNKNIVCAVMKMLLTQEVKDVSGENDLIPTYEYVV
jgi:hypothetical protein